MEPKKVTQTFLSRLQRFVAVNLFAQKILFEAYGVKWYWFNIGNTLVHTTSSIIDAFIFGLIINYVQEVIILHKQQNESFYYLFGALVLWRLFVRLYRALFDQLIWYKRRFALPNLIEKKVMDKLVYLNWEHVEDPETEKLIQTSFRQSIEYIQILSQLHIDIIVLAFSLPSTFILVNIPLWVLALIIAKELPSLVVRAFGEQWYIKADDDSQTAWTVRNRIFGYFREFRILFEVKISRGYDLLFKMHQKAIQTIYNAFHIIDKKLVLPWQLVGIYETAINSWIVFYYLQQVLYHSLLLGTFQYTVSIISNLGDQLFTLVNRINDSVSSYRYVAYAYNLMSIENTVKDGTEELASDIINIEFRHVWFKYPHTKKYSLRDINITFKDNARVAIVGENGAGKSTFLKLLNGVYEPTKGEILVNGIPLYKYKKESFHKKVAIVTQEFAMYNVLSVAENIMIYDYQTEFSQERLERAAELAKVSDFIETLPQKFNTVLTKTIEGGAELSTGQWQRIAIARQFYANRPLIILDEPTSAIDPLAEATIFENLYHHVTNKTVVVVSHRYNTVRSAQEILVFNNGRVIEQGTHQQLLTLDGYYAKAYHVQQEVKKL